MNGPGNGIALSIALLGAGWLSAADEKAPLPKDLATAKVAVTNLQPKIVERGGLEARDNNDVKCELRAGKRGTKIKWIVDNGSQVKKGDLILELDDSELREKAAIENAALEAARAEVIAAEKVLKLKKEAGEVKAAEAELRKKRAILGKQEAVHKELLEQIAKCKIRAPVAGIAVYHVPELTRKGPARAVVAAGEYAELGQTVLSIPDLSRMLMRIGLVESLRDQIKVGQQCEIRVDAIPGKTLKGIVKQVGREAAPSLFSPDVKLYPAVLEFTGPVKNLRLKPGLSAVCEIFTGPRAERVLAIPSVAILPPQKDRKPRCLIVTPRGAEEREIELGRRDEGMVEIKAGLKEGDEVVIDKRVLPARRPLK